MTVTILTGDVIDMLRTLPADHFGCVVTSPPYWGLRDYGVPGQLGLEPTLEDHIAAMVRVFDEVRRVLHPAGTLWVNYGDCYATTPNGRSAAETKAAGTDDRAFRDKPFSTIGGGLKPKDLCMVPARFAIAMQEAGWWVRSEIIWAKPNPMPDSSGVYRPSTAHEKIYMFAKADGSDFYRARDTGEVRLRPDLTERCALITDADRSGPRWIRLGHYYDADGVRQDRKTEDDGKAPDGWDTGAGGHGTLHRAGRQKGAKADKQRGHSRRHEGFNGRWDQMTREEQSANGRLLHNYEPASPQVWEIATKPFKEQHFATFPPDLVARCLQAGAPPKMPVLDPFGGAGTTGIVADKFGLDCTLIEINPDYVALARRRLAAGLVRMDSPATPAPLSDKHDDHQGVLL